MKICMLRRPDISNYIFVQERIGKDGDTFEMYKFRTMYPNSVNGSNGRRMRNPEDPRVTPLGRFLRRYWLDEIPQLINIARGEMSWIGIRPASRDFYELLPEDVKEGQKKYLPGLVNQLYADDVKTWDDMVGSMRNYLQLKSKHGEIIDFVYFLRFLGNVLFGGTRGV